MLSEEQNRIFTQVGPRTPMGEVLRRYWWPVWFSEEVTDKPVPVRVLGEDLVLFRDGQGRVGLLDRHCSHRRSSLEFGRVEPDGIRCCYHGWLYDVEGKCLDTPAEAPGSTLKDKIQHLSYRTEEAGGLVFANLGPDPAPILPKFDLLFREDLDRSVWAMVDHCNWLQRAENAVDIFHSMALHAPVYPSIALQRPEAQWEDRWYGLRQEANYPNGSKNVSHFIFPSHTQRMGARVGDTHVIQYLHLRLPVDDEKTLTFMLETTESEDSSGLLETRGLKESERGVYERVEDGWWGVASADQDRAAQESQGVITDRTREHLGSSDRGLLIFRKMLEQSLKAVEAGKDPFGILRDPGGEEIIFLDSDKNFSDIDKDYSGAPLAAQGMGAD